MLWALKEGTLHASRKFCTLTQAAGATIPLTEHKRTREECNRQYYLKNKEALRERNKQYYLANKESLKERSRQYRLANKDAVEERSLLKNKDKKERKRHISLANKEALKERRRQYYLMNKDSFKERNRQYHIQNKEANKERKRQYDKQYRLANKEALKEKRRLYRPAYKEARRQYYLKYKEVLREKNRQYCLANKETLKERSKQYRLANKEKSRQYRLINEEKSRQYRLINKEKSKQYRLANKEALKITSRQYYLKNREAKREIKRQYYLKNKEAMKVAHRQYYLKNKEDVKERSRQYRLWLRQSHPRKLKKWQTAADLRFFFESIKAQLFVDKPEDWYRVSTHQLASVGGTSTLEHKKHPTTNTNINQHTNINTINTNKQPQPTPKGSTLPIKYGNLGKALKIAYPNFDWDESMFSLRGKKSGQRWLKLNLQQILPEDSIIEEDILHPNLFWDEESQQRMELDLWVPRFNLALEYQGEHHYYDLPSAYGKTLTLYTDRDLKKKKACEEQNITLISIPFWWNGDRDTLAATLHAKRPDIFSPVNSQPISMDLPMSVLGAASKNTTTPTTQHTISLLVRQGKEGKHGTGWN